MFSLREEITRTLLRFKRDGTPIGRAGAGTSDLRSDSRVGRQYNSYRILRLLGAGGMGCVYLALDTRLGRHVALKFLPSELAGDSEFLQRFQQEARTASSLSHPNIVTIYDFTEIDGDAVLVSEFIEGTTLRCILDNRREVIDIDTAIGIAGQVTSALVAAHGAGIIHRDLKPSNIMVRPDGYVKVIDFGLAKFSGRHAGSTRTHVTQPGSVLGTVDYLSPEQARGLDVDARTDLWSLGVVIYEMISHRRPFGGDTDSHVIVGILDNEPLPLATTGDLAPGLSQIVDRALKKDRRSRYQSAREVLADLQELRHTPLVPVPKPLLVAEQKPRRSGRFVAAGLLAIVLIAACVWWWAMGGKQRVLGPRWFEIASTRQITQTGDVGSAVISPNGKYLAYVSGEGSGRLHLRNLADSSDASLPSAPGAYAWLTFSPDSRTLYYVLRQGEIGRVFASPVAGFGQTPSALIVENADGPLAFSPSGADFVFLRGVIEGTHATNSILLGSESNPRNVQPILSLPGTQIRDHFAWSPKGDWIAAITFPPHLNTPARATVSLIDRKGHVRRSFVPPNVRSLYIPLALDGGSLLLFTAVPESALERHLLQLYVPTGEFHEVPTDLLGFDNISITADSRTLASVREDQRSSIWEAHTKDLSHPRKLSQADEPVARLGWLNDRELIYPSNRSQSVNLVRLKEDGVSTPAASRQSCIEQFPVAVPHSSLVVYASNCAHGADDFNLWKIDLATGERRLLTSGSSYDDQPDASPDGKWIVYISWTSNVPSLWKLPVEGGIPVPISRRQAKLPFYSPDGTRIVAQTRDPMGPWRVEVLDAGDGSVIQRFPKLPAGTLPVHWSPDGKALDYIANANGNSAIWRQPLTGGPPRQLANVSGDSISDFAWTADGTKLAYVRSRAERNVFLFDRK